MYIVLFPNKTMIPMLNKPYQNEFKQGSKLFKVDPTFTIDELSRWYGLNNSNNCQAIKEIEWKK